METDPVARTLCSAEYQVLGGEPVIPNADWYLISDQMDICLPKIIRPTMLFVFGGLFNNAVSI
jgi:hypothetical protein